MATTIILTIAAICSKFNITEEQFSKATKVVMNGLKAFYIVESLSTPGQEYKVEWNDEYKCLQCLPHNGEACPASKNGLQCWHKRAALASEEHYKATEQARRKQEQAEVEATPQYQADQLQQAMYELEVMHEALLASQQVTA